MQKYKSHKVVEAAKIIGFQIDSSSLGAILTVDENGRPVGQSVTMHWLDKNAPRWGTPDAEVELVGGYFVRYDDGYTSWSPAEAFEKGYTPLTHDPKDGALPVSGYQPQTDEKVQLVNSFKADEERLLRKLDAMKHDPNIDQRWLAIGRTGLETAFMAVNRSVFVPGRSALSEDETPYSPPGGN